MPSPWRAAFKDLAALDDDAARKLVDAFSGAGRFPRVEVLVDAARQGMPASADSLVAALLSARSVRGSTPSEIARDLSRSEDLALESGEQERLQNRLAELLGLEALATTSNAVDLLTQHPQNFRAARVFSDIRPVFGDDVQAPPAGAVIVETLQIGVWSKDGSTDVVYVAMDESDLRELRLAIDRALDKTETLKAMLVSQKLAYFEFSGREAT